MRLMQNIGTRLMKPLIFTAALGLLGACHACNNKPTDRAVASAAAAPTSSASLPAMTLPNMVAVHGFPAASSGGHPYFLVRHHVVVKDNKLATKNIGRQTGGIGRELVLDLKTGKIKVIPGYTKAHANVLNVVKMPADVDMRTNPKAALQVLSWMEDDVKACISADDATITGDKRNLLLVLDYIRSLKHSLGTPGQPPKAPATAKAPSAAPQQKIPNNAIAAKDVKVTFNKRIGNLTLEIVSSEKGNKAYALNLVGGYIISSYTTDPKSPDQTMVKMVALRSGYPGAKEDFEAHVKIMLESLKTYLKSKAKSLKPEEKAQLEKAKAQLEKILGGKR
ncbi:MAG: hypothetical protein ABIH22_02105 [Candidatus Margulisiibacteriota bacterium]